MAPSRPLAARAATLGGTEVRPWLYSTNARSSAPGSSLKSSSRTTSSRFSTSIRWSHVDARVVAEVDAVGRQRVEAPDRAAPALAVGCLPVRQLLELGMPVDAEVVGGIPDQHLVAVRAHQHALVPDCVSRGRQGPDAVGYLGVAVQQLESRPREVEPV